MARVTVLLYGATALALLVTLLRRLSPEPPDPKRRALAILNERFARGEIDQDEYLERRACLE